MGVKCLYPFLYERYMLLYGGVIILQTIQRLFVCAAGKLDASSAKQGYDF